MRKITTLIVCLLHLTLVKSSNYADSLQQIVKSNIPVNDKIDAYHELFNYYIYSDPEKAKKYNQTLYNLNKDKSCPKCEIYADLENGDYYSMMMDSKKAIYYFDQSATKSLKIKNYEMYEVAKIEKINTLIQLAEKDNALQDLDELILNKKATKNEVNIEYIYALYGDFYNSKNYKHSAQHYYLKSLEIMEKIKSDDYKLKIKLNLGLATLYSSQRNYKKAKEFINKALVLADLDENQSTKMIVFNLGGVVESLAEHSKEAIKYLEKSYSFFKTNEVINYQLEAAHFLGKCYLETNDLEKAIFYSNMVVNDSNSHPSSRYMSLAYAAHAQLKQGKLALARENLDKALNMTKMVPTPNKYVGQVYKVEIAFLTETKQFEAALQKKAALDTLNEQLKKKTDIDLLNDLEAKYESKKKEEQIKSLTAQSAIDKKIKYIYLALLALLLILALSTLYVYSNKIKTAKKLKELNEMKSKFFTNVAHEFRTPLTLISSPLQSLMAETKDSDQLTKLSLIDKSSNRMIDLVDQLLELSKLESGKLKLFPKEGNISTFLKALLEPFKFQAEVNNLTFNSNVQVIQKSYSYDHDVIEKIVGNLLSNAIKYTPLNETIVFTSSIDNDKLHLTISNSGTKIKKEELPKIFERFYQTNESNHGVGIGLALVKELVQLCQGKIDVYIEQDCLIFNVLLPLEITNNTQHEVEDAPQIDTFITDLEVTKNTELPVLLIIDDNTDVRTLLKSILGAHYQIIEAENGKKGWELAQKEIPNCVVCDVRMPEMDGFELTKLIKNNELTSFIPVILLTASTSDDAHLEGLKSTADVFLTKPFKNDILIATINQLILERKKLQQRYSQELVLRPLDIKINSLDEKFISKLQQILEKEMANPDFSSTDFALEIGMSRMQLHRKLKSLLGVSSTEFLRNERLKAASNLIKKGTENISDVAYAVGFNNISYFSKCFKEMFGCSPTEYSEKS